VREERRRIEAASATGSPPLTAQERTELIRLRRELKEMTSAWVNWYDTRRLMHRLGRRPPVEVEQEYYGRLAAESETVHT